MSDSHEPDLSQDEEPGDQFEGMRSAKPWLDMIKQAEKSFQNYQDKCDNIDKQYADLKSMADAGIERQMKVFWANLEVLKPSIYSRPPVPVVVSRFKGRKPILRHASEILERVLLSSFDQEDINETMLGVRDDLAVAGRGVTWLRLEEDEEGSQRVCYDHLDRKDFAHDPARKWKEVQWVARRTHNTREEMRERFEEDSGDAFLGATYSDKDSKKEGDDHTVDKTATVWELWHKGKGIVVWVTDSVEGVLDIREPFLDLHGYFPCPRPAYGTVERATLLPVPDFVYYKDQLEEINELTARISALSESLRMKGFYAAGNEDVSGALETAFQNTDNNALLIPVPNFGSMGAAGLKDSIIWLPVNEVASVIGSLIDLRKQLIEDVYQITGISDIMRGSTNANETLGAQQLKSQYGSVRVRDRQAELVRVARDMTRIAAEIMAENFNPETMLAMSQYDEVPKEAEVQQKIQDIESQIEQAKQNPALMAQAQENPEQAQQLLQKAQQEIQKLGAEVTLEKVLEFLASERVRPFALDIETDSTIQPDEDAQKKRSTEFLGALSGAIGQLGPMVQAQPESAPFVAEVLKFAVSPFRAGRSLEQAIEEFAESIKKQAAQPKENPAAKQAEQEAKDKQADMQIRQTEMQGKQMETQAKMTADGQRLAGEMEKMRADVDKTRAETEKLHAQIAEILAGPADTNNVGAQ